MAPKKGTVPWNKGLTKEKDERVKGYWKDKKMSKSHKDNLSESHKGQHNSPKTEFKKGMRSWNKGTKGIMNPNITSFKEGEISAFKGKQHSMESKEKNRDAHIGLMIGDKHPNWQGGKSFEPYSLDFNNKFRESIRGRDNYCCLICNKRQEELDHTLHVHHVDYDKKNSFPQNCASLCRKNHIETNINRVHWTKFLQSLLAERYGYEYTEDQKIILDFNEVIS